MTKKRLFFFLLSVPTLFLIYFISIFTYNTVYDYVPKNKIEKILSNDILTADTLNILSWNIGYAGMGSKMDFFYDGGKNVYPPYSYYKKCLDSIAIYLSKFDKQTNICLLQEVDFYSKRSYFENQKIFLHNSLKNKKYCDSLINYNVPYVPFPLFNPLGRVKAGLVTFSAKRPVIRAELYFGNTYSWPKQIFFLDRGVLIHAYKTSNQKLLFIVNVHLSAFDDATDARTKEMSLLKKLISVILKNKHYLIVAGDWNINPPNFCISNQFTIPYYFTEKNLFSINDAFFAYDSIVPTNRNADIIYTQGKTPVTTIDYILVSKNIKVLRFNAMNFNFLYSDHNPIFFSLILN